MRGFRLCPQAIERHWSLHATIAYCVARADSERWGLQRRIMKIIFTTKQIPEISQLSWRDRQAIIRRHHWKAFTDRHGLLSMAVFAIGIVSGMILPGKLWPDVSCATRLLASLAIMMAGLLIHLPLYYRALRPHIQAEMAFWKGRGLS